ncbi:putative zinc-binding dehydrogenase family oxidoreductase [Aspergillus crustosus]
MPIESNTALVVRVVDGKPKLSKEAISIPRPAANQVLVKLSHVAQNPTDVQSFDSNAFGDGVVLGCDFVGEVVELGGDVTRLKKGDLVSALIWGGETKYVGAYSEYCVADERISFKVPPSISPEHASTVPLAAATAWLALFSRDSIALERGDAKGTTVLVWGGSSSVGLYTIQLASILGFEVITTCSPKHADLVRSYGARHVFDYRDDDIVSKIKDAVPDLAYAFDTIGNATSSATASKTLNDGNGGRLCTVRPGKANTEHVVPGTTVTDVLVWTAFLKEHRYKEFRWPASKEDHELASELFKKLPGWLENGTIKASHPKVLRGLEAVSEGFQEHRDGKISAYKIVYEI